MSDNCVRITASRPISCCASRFTAASCSHRSLTTFPARSFSLRAKQGGLVLVQDDEPLSPNGQGQGEGDVCWCMRGGKEYDVDILRHNCASP